MSKLDRGLELEWLADRPAVQRVLADILQTPRSRITDIVGDVVARDQTGRHRVRLVDLPYSAPLDLTAEPLPPGIPDVVTHPSAWRRLWWVAPSGSGRSLAGAWLQARGLAVFISARDAAQAQTLVPDGDLPVFVELSSEPLDLAWLPIQRALCVAAPVPPPNEQGFWIVESPAPDTFIEHLVRWMALRLPRDGHFSPNAALAWLRAAIERGDIDGLGAALGFAGLIDQYGVNALEREGLDAITDRFLRDRVSSELGAPLADEGAAWLAGHGRHVIDGIARRLLVDAAQGGWDLPRAFEEWVRLVPEGTKEPVDAEWVRLSLARASVPPPLKEIERALRELPPGAFRIVRALADTGLLRKTATGDALALGPRWLVQRAVRAARLRIVDGTPEEWGEALLEPRTAGFVFRALLSRARGGDFSALEDALDADSREPYGAAAVEAAFRAAGLSCLSGAEPPPDLLESLWQSQKRLLVELDVGSFPRVHYPGATEPLLDVGMFQLASLAMGEALGHGRFEEVGTRWLRRGRDATAPFDSIFRAVARLDLAVDSWGVEAFSLAERLFDLERGLEPGVPDAKPAASRRALHPLEWPAAMLSLLERGSLEWSDVRSGATTQTMTALFGLARRRQQPEPAIAIALWRAWAGAPEVLADDSPLHPRAQHAALMFGAVPREALSALSSGRFVQLDELPFEHFREGTWRDLFDVAPAALRGVTAAFRVLPVALVPFVLGRGAFALHDLSVLWSRAPEGVERTLTAWITRRDPRALALVRTAPGLDSIVQRLRTALAEGALSDAESRAALRAYAHRCVAERAPCLRAAFDLLGKLD